MKMNYVILLLTMILTIITPLTAGLFGPSTIDIDLTESNHVYLTGTIGESETDEAIEQIMLKADKVETLYLVIKSPGGYIYAGERFIDTVSQYKNIKTVTIFAASMADNIVQSLPGERLILKSGALMAHRAAGGFQGQFNDGEVESQLAFWKTIVTGMEERASSRIGISLKEYKANVVNEWWSYGAQAIKENRADNFATLKCSQELIDKKIIISKNVGSFIPVIKNFEKSACPLLEKMVEVK